MLLSVNDTEIGSFQRYPPPGNPPKSPVPPAVIKLKRPTFARVFRLPPQSDGSVMVSMLSEPFIGPAWAICAVPSMANTAIAVVAKNFELTKRTDIFRSPIEKTQHRGPSA